MNVIDRFLPEGSFQNLKEHLLSPKVSWTWHQHKTGPRESTDSFQFVHTFYKLCMPQVGQPIKDVCNDMNPLGNIFYKLQPYAVLKVKANLTPRTAEPDKTDFHVDFPHYSHHDTAIYYLNTNNGYTEFKSGEIVESIENRLVIFDASEEHRGVSCTDEKYRLVLNLNYVRKPEIPV